MMRGMLGQAGNDKIKYIKQPASHQGVARNRGVREAIGEIIVFIGDDILVEPGFLQKHLLVEAGCLFDVCLSHPVCQMFSGGIDKLCLLTVSNLLWVPLSRNCSRSTACPRQ